MINDIYKTPKKKLKTVVSDYGGSCTGVLLCACTTLDQFFYKPILNKISFNKKILQFVI